MFCCGFNGVQPEPGCVSAAAPLSSWLWCQMKIFLGAVVDGNFLMDTADELLKRKEVLKVPVMMGITNHEFGWILPQVENAGVPSDSNWIGPLISWLCFLLFSTEFCASRLG